MPLDAQAQVLLDNFRKGTPRGINRLSVAEARRHMATLLTSGDHIEAVDSVQNLAIDGLHSVIKLRYYRPQTAIAVATILYLHGGGWMLNSLDTHDSVCRRLVNLSRCAVMAVDYRLAPESKFPAAIEDAWAVLNWLKENYKLLYVDLDRLVIAGDSSGANLATVIAMRSRNHNGPKLAAQILICPVTDHWTTGHRSYRKYESGYSLTRDQMIWFWENYLPSNVDFDNPSISPLRARNLKNMPATLLINAEYDPLHDEARLYAKRLKLSGIATHYYNYDGMMHNFVMFFQQLDKGKLALKQIAAFLQENLQL